ncbi:M15 family metallopeptidase [Patescibacteria group bacterium]|nr:M15 family metallopeptidase [Patescibacteria group bacterium]
MFNFSNVSKKRLETCHKDLQTICNELIKAYDFTIICGHRGEKKQNEAFNKGASKLKFPKSKHNKMPSLAVDIAPFIGGKISWKTDHCKFLASLFMEIAKKLKEQEKITSIIRWGGDWDMDGDTSDNRFNDLVHFEIYK